MALLERCDKDAVAHLTMNAPERLNALSDEMLAALQETLNAIAATPDLRAVVIKGAGKGFCAGHDLRQMTAARQADDDGRAYFKDLFDRCTTVMTTIRTMPQPVIAQVHGIATAAGCQLVATCDMAIAAEDTKFGVNGINVGLFCSTPMVALSRNIVRKKAFEMLTTGTFLSAQGAEASGLINRAVPAAELEDATTALARAVAEKSGAVLRIGKEAFYNQLEMPVDAAYGYTRDVMVENLLHRASQEGINAFLEKRPPDWDQ